MSFHVPEMFRVRPEQRVMLRDVVSGRLLNLGTTPVDGNIGCFRFQSPIPRRRLHIIASDGEDWEHVSVSVMNKKHTPTWAEMCHVKDLFWDDEDVVMQLHPAKSEYVNNHSTCLHLWRPTRVGIIPTPKTWLVGVRTGRV